jgi:hypothetical protein
MFYLLIGIRSVLAVACVEANFPAIVYQCIPEPKETIALNLKNISQPGQKVPDFNY